jgi:hypothetical protein
MSARFLEKVFDGFDVVVGRRLDRLDLASACVSSN